MVVTYVCIMNSNIWKFYCVKFAPQIFITDVPYLVTNL